MTAIGFGGIRVRCVLEVKVYESVDSPAAGGIRILSKIPLRGAKPFFVGDATRNLARTYVANS